MKSITVAVLYGGISSEREVSLRSGKTIIEALKAAGLSVATFDTKTELAKFITAAEKGKISIVVPVLHGAFGEDGTLQGLLELLNVPYLFSDCRASALCMDKELTKIIVGSAGVPILPQIVLRSGETIIFKKGSVSLRLPIVVKPATAGSSVGVSIVTRANELEDAVGTALKHSDRAIMEPYINGREVTVGVLNIGKKYETLPITEIIPESDTFYSYDAKYAKGGSRHVCPADISLPLAKIIRAQALAAFHALGCRDIARADFLIDKRGQPYFLEMNTIPGMTATSLVPESIKASGKTLPAVLAQLITERIRVSAGKK